MKKEIIIYQAEETSLRLEVRIEDDSLWLTHNQIVELFESSKVKISEHIKNIFETKELDEDSTVRKIRIVQIEGGRKVSRELLHYNLDMIISLGYRVNSIRGTQFRIWANKVLKDYLLKGYAVSQRFERIESEVNQIKNKLSEINFQISTNLPPNEGIFYEGKDFEAYVFVSEIIKSAKNSIILIDNYIDENLLLLLSKRNKGLTAIVFTRTISKQLELDIKKHNRQYPEIELKQFSTPIATANYEVKSS